MFVKKLAEVVALNKMRNAAVVSYQKVQKERKRLESATQVVGITANFNRHPVHNYRTDSRHEEGNYYASHRHGYRTFDDVAYRLGVNDGWILRYGLSEADETIRRYQPIIIH